MNLKLIFEVIDLDADGEVVVPKSQAVIACDDEALYRDALLRGVHPSENFERVVNANMLVVTKYIAKAIEIDTCSA